MIHNHVGSINTSHIRTCNSSSKQSWYTIVQILVHDLLPILNDLSKQSWYSITNQDCLDIGTHRIPRSKRLYTKSKWPWFMIVYEDLNDFCSRSCTKIFYIWYTILNQDRLDLGTWLFRSRRGNIWKMTKIVYQVGIWRNEKRKEKNERWWRRNKC